MSDILNPLSMEIPADRDNEALILSNAIKNKDNRKIFVGTVTPTDFSFNEFKAIAWSINTIEQENLIVDPEMILLKSKISPFRYPLEMSFIQDMLSQFEEVASVNFTTHVQKMHVDKIKRDVAKSAMEGLYQACLNPKSDLSYIQDRIRFINSIMEKGVQSATCGFKGMDILVPEYLENKSKTINFRTTGFRQLDEKLSEGLKEGKITIVAALPSMGKTSFTLSMMKNLSHRGIWAAQFALEMDSLSLVDKLMAFNTQIPISRINKNYNQLTSDEKKLIQNELQRLQANRYLLFNDTPTQTLKQIREQIMLLQDRLKEQYIVVPIDLFGKISDFAKSSNFANDYEKKLNETQKMARELGIHFILVAQINRGAVNRSNKFGRPKMSDLKNSGAFEEVADIIFGVHRPYYDPEKALKAKMVYGDDKQMEDKLIDDDPNKNIAEVIILKQRMGINNDLVNFYFDPDTTRFSPIDSAEQEAINRSKPDINDEE